jgi:hypothetical protein
VTNGFLEEQVGKMQAAVSTRYSRGMFEPLRDRKDRYELDVRGHLLRRSPLVASDDGVALGKGWSASPQRRRNLTGVLIVIAERLR